MSKSMSERMNRRTRVEGGGWSEGEGVFKKKRERRAKERKERGRRK